MSWNTSRTGPGWAGGRAVSEHGWVGGCASAEEARGAVTGKGWDGKAQFNFANRGGLENRGASVQGRMAVQELGAVQDFPG